MSRRITDMTAMTATLLTIATTDANAGGGDTLRSSPCFRD